MRIYNIVVLTILIAFRASISYYIDHYIYSIDFAMSQPTALSIETDFDPDI